VEVTLLIIRQETPLNYAEVYRLVKMSFATVSHDDGTVPDYLAELREKDVLCLNCLWLPKTMMDKLSGKSFYTKPQLPHHGGKPPRRYG